MPPRTQTAKHISTSLWVTCCDLGIGKGVIWNIPAFNDPSSRHPVSGHVLILKYFFFRCADVTHHISRVFLVSTTKNKIRLQALLIPDPFWMNQTFQKFAWHSSVSPHSAQQPVAGECSTVENLSWPSTQARWYWFSIHPTPPRTFKCFGLLPS